MRDFFKRIREKIPNHIQFIFVLYITGILFFTLFRLLLFFTNTGKLVELPEGRRLSLIVSAMIMGFRFDTVILGYILALPFLLLSAGGLIKSGRAVRRYITVAAFYTAGVLFTISFMICSADIPFFNYYFSRLTTAVFNWADETKFMIGMVAKEVSYSAYVLAFFAVSGLFWYVYIKYFKKLLTDRENTAGRIAPLGYFVLTAMLLFVGIRGRLEMKSPIRAGTAFFSAYAFPNQLGLNPVFTFIRSYFDDLEGKSKVLALVDEQSAVSMAAASLGADVGKYQSPLARYVAGKPAPDSLNVVLVIMESMSADKMRRYGSGRDLTPFLDSLANCSRVFDNFFSAGIHTYNGVYSSNFAYPALLKQHPMKMTTIPRMTGLPVTLKKNGYSTIFFTTHDEQFDNMSGFMYSNGFEKVVSQKDYPSEFVVGPTGVPDHILFDQAIPYLNALASKGKPFYASLLTASDHGPYFIPENIPFKPGSADILSRIIEYADWSLKHFIEQASHQPWFNRTLFVFVADHGASLNPVYELPISYVHSPCIMFSTSFNNVPRVSKAFGGQVDLFPTIMDILGFPYVNNTMGVNLFSGGRPCMYFSADEKIGCVNGQYYYLRRADGRESLYNYRTGSTVDELSTRRATADSLRAYAFSMMQAAQTMLKQKKTGPQQ